MLSRLLRRCTVGRTSATELHVVRDVCERLGCIIKEPLRMVVVHTIDGTTHMCNRCYGAHCMWGQMNGEGTSRTSEASAIFSGYQKEDQ